MSYKKQEFIDYMQKKGYLNPGAYCNGLDNVEKYFVADIDAEFEKDQCTSLYDRIQEIRLTPEIIGKNEHDVRTYASRLKKYVEYRQDDKNIIKDNVFTWIPFYEEFATKLLAYKNNRKELLQIIKSCFDELPLEYPFKEHGKENYEDVDPFTIFGSFNKGIKEENRIAIIKKYKKAFSVEADIPKDFIGIPVLMNMSAWFFAYKANRNEDDIDNLWKLFEVALAYADGDYAKKNDFVKSYNQVKTQKQVKWNITIGLYWVRPKAFLSLDSVSRIYLLEFKFPVGLSVRLKNLPNGEDYLKDIENVKNTFGDGSTVNSFYELSREAFEYNAKTDEKNDLNKGWWPSLDEFDPQLTKEDWIKFILEVEKPEHPSPMQMLKAMLELGGEASCKKLAELYGGTPNRYVGCASNLGRRIKQFFDLPACMDGDQERYFPFPFVGKKENNEYVYRMRLELKKALEEMDLSDVYLYVSDEEENNETKNVEEIEIECTSYTKKDFLKDVFISEDKYNTCVSRIKHKKNIILQGAPGVGKTYAARRLAWSIMGVKDNSRIEFVQFHQSYSYEDFIMGYKPVDNGFQLEKGIFYEFCIKAKNDQNNDYFFIIDEINRGNMSKIFGELLMLIENDYRGTEIKLAYNKKAFSIPGNLYIIGMMNTADRSLAMIDYALRRRFSFIEMIPGFEAEGFKEYQATIKNELFGKIIGRIKALNADIENDASLGKGFCIGHSYFCNLDEQCSDSILKEIVEYDIVPMLEEYWFDDKAKADSWASDLRGVLNG